MTNHPRAREVTGLLQAWQQGDRGALDRLIPLVYDELRNVARARLRAEPAGHILQTTALVHEAYLRLVDIDRITVRDRTHLFALAARLMRQILVDQARRKNARKRGGEVKIVGLEGVTTATDPPAIDVLALDEALTELASVDPHLCQVVEVKFFAGLTIAEMADALSVSAATAVRDWTVARAWLYQRLSIGSERKDVPDQEKKGLDVD
ncbi:MAG TPA: sigma-70 family RNA polymerase sigma factor [Vicinamibacterales bacterium]|nr:sigma-70 family RNA polymerase sigma factor [Vicinamibacterales bacterium]